MGIGIRRGETDFYYLKKTFSKIYKKLPESEKNMPVCPINNKVLTWNQVKFNIDKKMLGWEGNLIKLRELKII